MATIRVRHLIMRPGPAGGLPRFFWQPSPALREAGFRAQRVPLDWFHYTDANGLQAAAIARAEDLNNEADTVRARAALATVRPPAEPPRTLGALSRAYQGSDAWRQLAPATQRGYRQCLAKLEAWAGDAPVRAIDEVRVQRLLSSLSTTPAYANATVRVLRLVLEWGRRNGWAHWLPTNPAGRPGLRGTDPSGIVWPREAVQAFVATADRLGRHSIGTAVLLNEWLGQREADILRMPRTVLRGGMLLIRQQKTGAGVPLPISMVPHLAERLEAEMARTAQYNPVATTIIVSEETRRPYLSDNFRHVFASIRAETAKQYPAFEVNHLLPGRDMAAPDAFVVHMESLIFMALRHTAVTRLAEAGCDAPLIASISGHSQETINVLLRRYMTRTAEMARTAFQRRIDAELARNT